MAERSIAVVGCGRWGKNLVRNFAALGALRVVCDSDPAKLRVVAEQYPTVNTTDSYQEILLDPNIQAVVIAAPAVVHASLARQALEVGKDLFVEKPLALTVADARSVRVRRRRISRAPGLARGPVRDPGAARRDDPGLHRYRRTP